LNIIHYIERVKDSRSLVFKEYKFFDRTLETLHDF